MVESTVQVSEGRGTGVARAAEAMIRALGGTSVALLFPVLTAEDSHQHPGLGLDGSGTQQIEIAPVAMLSLPTDPNIAATRLELLIPGSAVFATMAERVAASPQNLFDSALGVIHEGRLLRIQTWTADHFAGLPYLFRVTVQG